MTLIAQEIPKVGLVMEEVKVVRWLKGVGDAVVAGEPLLEVETEKAVVEIEAAATGRLSQILVQIDSRAAVGDQVAWIETAEAEGAAAAPPVPREADPEMAARPPARAASTARGEARDEPRDEARGEARDEPRDEARGEARGMVSGAARIRSTPVARKLAGEHGIDLGGITGTGPGGRVQIDDVQRAIDASRRTGTAARPAGAAARPLSPMRRALARAMTLSNATIPQFTVTRALDWTELQALNSEFAARLGPAAPKLSVNDFLLQALARTLSEFPALNAMFSGEPDSADARIVPASGAHIGLVVAVDDGLLAPVIHDVEQLGLAEIARRREACVERGLKRRLRPEDTGATISISNLGAAGPDRFTAIINPPQSAILAVGRRRDCVVVRDAAIVVRPLSDLTLTVDHRVADGRLASQFLARLIEILEGRVWRWE